MGQVGRIADTSGRGDGQSVRQEQSVLKDVQQATEPPGATMNVSPFTRLHASLSPDKEAA